ncbi:YadA-like family protein, partial [Salmonella enterica]|nr:YadA-like family protein [Salmonella enterica]
VISGIKSGSAPSDAVNVSQLIRVVNAIGGGAKINSEGALTGPEYTVVTTDGQHRTLTDAGQALTALNEEVNKPMIFEGDEGTHSVRLGSTMKIKGDGKGITTVVSGDTLTVRMGGTQTPDHVVVNQSLSLAKEANVDMGGNIIHNVGAGKAPGDAVNYGQLQQAFGGLDKRINRVARRADAGAAAAIATAGLTQAYLPGKSMMSMSGGSFQGQNSLAIGLSTISDNGKWVMKGAFTTTTQSQTGASVGIGYQF